VAKKLDGFTYAGEISEPAERIGGEGDGPTQEGKGNDNGPNIYKDNKP
jgi:hypothetical protein